MTDNPTDDPASGGSDVQGAITTSDWRLITGTLNTMPFNDHLAGPARVTSVDDLLAWLRRYSEALTRVAAAADTKELELIDHRQFVADARRVFGVLVNGRPVVPDPPMTATEARLHANPELVDSIVEAIDDPSRRIWRGGRPIRDRFSDADPATPRPGDPPPVVGPNTPLKD